MPKYFSIVFLLILSMYYTAECSGQKYNNNWVFGIEAGIDFNTNPPTKRLNDSIQSPEGCTTISDPNTGELLFYSDGDTIYNRNHQVMPNGIGLGGHYSTTQGVLAVPDPGNLNKYYLFLTHRTLNLLDLLSEQYEITLVKDLEIAPFALTVELQ